MISRISKRGGRNCTAYTRDIPIVPRNLHKYTAALYIYVSAAARRITGRLGEVMQQSPLKSLSQAIRWQIVTFGLPHCSIHLTSSFDVYFRFIKFHIELSEYIQSTKNEGNIIVFRKDTSDRYPLSSEFYCYHRLPKF